MVVGAIEPAAWAAIPETKPTASSTPRLAADLTDVLRGKDFPSAIKLRELTPDWRALSTNGQFEFGNLQTFVGTFGGGSFATSYYTKGQTVTIGSETYIVAYSLLSLVDKVTPETSLNLSLLNLKTIGSMSNIRAFDTVKETKVLEKQLAALQLANVFDPTKTDPEKANPTEPTVKPAETKPTVRKKRRSIRKPIRRTRSSLQRTNR